MNQQHISHKKYTYLNVDRKLKGNFYQLLKMFRSINILEKKLKDRCINYDFQNKFLSLFANKVKYTVKNSLKTNKECRIIENEDTNISNKIILTLSNTVEKISFMKDYFTRIYFS